MESSPKYFDPQTLAKLRGLELRTRHIVEGYVSGMHASPFHGYSIEFAEHRQYAPGDDTRHIDWKVWGKTDKYYLKRYHEETNLACHLALDISQSMRYKSSLAALSKLEYAQCAAAALAWLILRQHDAVGLVAFDREIRRFVRASGNPSSLNHLLHAMETAPAGNQTRAGAVLHDLAERLQKRGVVIVISDLFDDPSALAAGLKHLRHRRHDVLVLHVLDPAEVEFPFYEATRFRAMEQAVSVSVDARAVRRAYLSELNDYLHKLKRTCRELAIDYAFTQTDQPLDAALAAFLSHRMVRSAGQLH